MKGFLLGLFPNLTAKGVIAIAACTVAGAAVAATATTVVWQKKDAQYQDQISRLEANAQQAPQDAAQKDDAGNPDIRIVDGMMQIWNGEEWVDYGPVDDVVSKDPFYENTEQKEATEKTVAQKKLAELGLTVDEEGKIVSLHVGDTKEDQTASVLVGTKSASAGNGKNSAKAAGANANAAANAALLPGVNALGIPTIPMASTETVNTSWTESYSGSGGGGGGSSSGSSSSESSDSGSSSSGSGSSGSSSGSSSSESSSSSSGSGDEGGGFDEGGYTDDEP